MSFSANGMPSCGSTRRIRASVSSTGERAPVPIRRERSAIERSWRSSVTRVAPGSEGEPGLAVDVDQHRVGNVPDADGLHEGELGGEGLAGQRVFLGPVSYTHLRAHET